MNLSSQIGDQSYINIRRSVILCGEWGLLLAFLLLSGCPDSTKNLQPSNVKFSLTGLYHCKNTNYHRASCLYRVLFSGQTGTLRQATSGSRSLILLVVSQPTSRQLLHVFARLDCVIFSCLEHSVEQVLTADLFTILLALADYNEYE